MHQTMLSKEGAPLLSYAVSKLSPEIFAHPVWLRFGEREASVQPGVIENLLSAAKNLQNDDAASACQILLICAVSQNHVGQHNDAMKIVQQALTLAKNKALAKELVWSAWGAVATCFQDENHEQTARYLTYLQDILSEQNEWVLADFADIVRQSLPHPEKDDTAKQTGSPRNQPLDDILTLTFDWIQHWGFSPQLTGTAFGSRSRHFLNDTAIPRSLFSVQRWKGWWNNFKLAIKGEFNLQPGENNSSQSITSFSFYGDSLPKQEIDIQVIDAPLGFADDPALPSVKPPNAESESKPASKDKRVPTAKTSTTAMVVQMLGSFSITIQDLPLKLPTSRGLSLLKYLMLHHKQDTPREVLMDIFWPDSDPEAARNNLNVAMHNLRQALRSVTDLAVIRFKDGAYGLSANLEIWLDVEEFEHCVKEGQRLEARKQLTAAVTEFEIAVNLYQGDFLADNPYEQWTVLDRERLRIAYLNSLDHLSQIYFGQEHYAACITLCQLILRRDLCREDAHCRLMQCYSRLGQIPIALRQYQFCAEALRTELEVDPAPETTRLYERIRHHERV